ncbi:hypothetical protein I79_011141 [Cricetulus griseus]|uniref:Uncharacterized protein n=1 Tax=Cricetulus griseus TaxID=10029 RepID=G3HKC2_CRIGR|nr:hypothetical protein I79_011141 [Cricetulus griseus]
MRPAVCDLCSPGSLPPTKIQKKEKVLVLPLITHLGGQNGDCRSSSLPTASRALRK